MPCEAGKGSVFGAGGIAWYRDGAWTTGAMSTPCTTGIGTDVGVGTGTGFATDFSLGGGLKVDPSTRAMGGCREPAGASAGASDSVSIGVTACFSDAGKFWMLTISELGET